MFAKSDVNGANANEIFKYVKEGTKYKGNKDLPWNFTKFLVDRNGNVFKYLYNIKGP